MKSLIYQHISHKNNREITTLYILGVPVFQRVIIYTEDRPHRACGFTAYASDAPIEYGEEADEEDDEQFIILPYGKEK